jgi:hypothetical protein
MNHDIRDLLTNEPSIGGVTNVVSIITTTITEYSVVSTTPSALPTDAKINPTSPRGTIPHPINQ